MPRNGSGVYSKPAGSTAVSGQTIASATFNTLIDDIVTDLNTDRPVAAGGTGASDAATARTNLGVGSSDDVTFSTVTATSFAGDVVDSNGNELVDYTATGSAVNQFGIANAATGNAPAISAAGDDTNISLNLVPKGTGAIQFNGVDAMAFVGVQRFTTAGADTYTPSTGVTHAIVRMRGGGGGGGGGDADAADELGAGEGGAQGGYLEFLIDVSAIGTSTLNIGAGGSGGNGTGSNGSDGGDTTWSDGTSSATAAGGRGGETQIDRSNHYIAVRGTAAASNTAPAGANLVALIADRAGAFGGFGIILDSTYGAGGYGGGEGGGAGQNSNPSTSSNGNAGVSQGAGGGGGVSFGSVGGALGGDGADGGIEILEFTTGAS